MICRRRWFVKGGDDSRYRLCSTNIWHVHLHRAMRWISRISNEIIGTSIQGSHFIYVNSECPIRITTERSINTSTRITFYVDEIFCNVIKWSPFSRDSWLDSFLNNIRFIIFFHKIINNVIKKLQWTIIYHVI